MQWSDFPPDDERLAEAIAASLRFAPHLRIDTVLRHVTGRRITALAHDPSGRPFVVKLFHGPRARGNHRRLEALRDAGLADTVPASLGHDPSGRVGIVGYRPGVVLDTVDDAAFVTACGSAGAALGELHRSGATLDREWTLDDEVTQLRNRAPVSLVPMVADVLDQFGPPHRRAVVPSHRDCHPRQLVVDGDRVAWIDLDDCAMAAPGLDVGNMLAHLTREHLVGRRSAEVAASGRAAFTAAYGWDGDERELLRWEVLSLTRLAGLAETRHRAPVERDALVREVQRRLWEVAAR